MTCSTSRPPAALAERTLLLGGATRRIPHRASPTAPCCNREPTEEEAGGFAPIPTIAASRNTEAAPAEALKAITFGDREAPADVLKEPELASWTLVANLLLNLDEAVTRT